MILRKTRKRLAALYDEAKAKDGAKISADHVRQILAKIDRKEQKIREALAEATDPDKRDKLTRKLTVIDEQRRRGEELLQLVRQDEPRPANLLMFLS